MSLSVNTNQSALTALQNLNTTNEKLTAVQGKISTGLSIQGPQDNASVWAIAQGQRADIGALAAVTQSLDRANSIAQVALSAGQSISDLLTQVKQQVVAAQDPSIDQSARDAINSDFKSLLKQITQVIQNAQFDGANMLDGSNTGIKFLANADATAFITLSTQNMSLGGSLISISGSASLGTATLAAGVLAQVNTSIDKVNQALGDMGSQATQITNHNDFVSKLTDVLNAGVGNLVDADLAQESAKLQALQVQQQLGTQALSIANQAPQVILQLFR